MSVAAEAEEEEGEDVDADSLQSQMHMWGRGRTLDDPGPSGQEGGVVSWGHGCDGVDGCWGVWM